MASFGSSLKARMAEAMRWPSIPSAGPKNEDAISAANNSSSTKKTNDVAGNQGTSTNNTPLEGAPALPKKKKATTTTTSATIKSTPETANAGASSSSSPKPKKNNKDKGAGDAISPFESEKSPKKGDGKKSTSNDKRKAGNGGGKNKQKKEISTEPIKGLSEDDNGMHVEKADVQKTANKDDNRKKKNKTNQKEISPESLAATGQTSEEEKINKERGEQQESSSPKKKNAKLGEGKKGTNENSKAIDDTHQAGNFAMPAVAESPKKGTKGKKGATGASNNKKKSSRTGESTDSDVNHPAVEKDGDGPVEVNPPIRNNDGDETAAAQKKTPGACKTEKLKEPRPDEFELSEPMVNGKVEVSKRNEKTDDHTKPRRSAKGERSTAPAEESIDKEKIATQTPPLILSNDHNHGNVKDVVDGEVQTNGSTGTQVGASSPIKKKKKLQDHDRINDGVQNVEWEPTSPNTASQKLREETLAKGSSAKRHDVDIDLGVSSKPSSPLKSPKAKELERIRTSSQSPRKKGKKGSTRKERTAKEADLITPGIFSSSNLDNVFMIVGDDNSAKDEVTDADYTPFLQPRDDENATKKENEVGQHQEKEEDRGEDYSTEDEVTDADYTPFSQPRDDENATKKENEVDQHQEKEEDHVDDESPTITLEASLSSRLEAGEQVNKDDSPTSDLQNSKDFGNLEMLYLATKPEEDDKEESRSHPTDVDNGERSSSSKTDCDHSVHAMETAEREIQFDNSCDAALITLEEKEAEIAEHTSNSVAAADSGQVGDEERTINCSQLVLEPVNVTQSSVPPVAIVSSNSPRISTQEERSTRGPSTSSNTDAMPNQPIDDNCRAKIDAAFSRLADQSKKEKVQELVVRIHTAEGFPRVRPPPLSDNEIVRTLTNSICDDPSIIEIKIDSDVRFEHIARSLVIGFAEGLRSNLHLTSLTMTGLALGDYFLFALATSMESNFVLAKVNLSNNQFTNEGLTEFCQSLGLNESCQEINLTKQQSKVVESSHEGIFDALQLNRTLIDLKVDFVSEKGDVALATILKRNREHQGHPTKDLDEKLIEFLRYEADLAEYLAQQRKAEQEMGHISDDEWVYLQELSILQEKYKAQDNLRDCIESTNESATDCTDIWTSDGSFLTSDFISKYLKEGQNTLTFDFCGQWRLFKRFSATDPARQTIVTKFVGAILDHPRCNDITGINMANSCLGSDFFVELSNRCLQKKSVLPKVRSINAETNFLTEPGIVALAKCISDPFTLQNLQVVKLENQKSLVSSRGEFALARAMCINRSVIVLSVRVRSLLEKQQINNYVVRNVDYLRQARRRKAIETGTLTGRKRTEMEVYFDKISSNDPGITEVDLVGNNKFRGLSDDEKVKAAKAFATNSQVKVVIMSNLGLDDRFAQALGEALASNSTIEKIVLDSNSISGEGIKALFSGLKTNSSVTEMQVRHQSKKLGSLDEDLLPDMLESNKSVIRLGIDLRSTTAKMKVDRKMTQNRDYQRKRRQQS